MTVSVAEFFGFKGVRARLAYHDGKRAKTCANELAQAIEELCEAANLEKDTIDMADWKSSEISSEKFKEVLLKIEQNNIFSYINRAKAEEY